MTNKVIKLGHTKLSDANAMGVYAAAYRFKKHRVITEADGSESEVPFDEIVYLLKLPGDGRKLWLKPSERTRVLEALQEVAPLGDTDRQHELLTASGKQPASAGSARSMSSDSGGVAV
jgi:hypothetical protein